MPTAAERRALVFLATVAVVGAGARVRSARGFAAEIDRAAGALPVDSGSPAARALRDQIQAVDSARSSKARSGKARSGKSRRPRGEATSRSQSRSVADEPTPDTDGVRRSRKARPTATAEFPIDVNSATAAELELLPRIGPALAARIVAWRRRHGPFDSVEALRHVPGIGVTTASLLAPLVTFTSGHRPFHDELPAWRPSESCL